MTDEIDYDWVDKQLSKSKFSEDEKKSVIQLLNQWENTDPTDNDDDVLDSFVSLAKGHSIVPNDPDELWVQAQIGFIHSGDRVRVKHDAFEGEAGRLHNGRYGKVQAARSGDVIFRSTDGLEPFLDGVHYPPYKLEIRLR